MNRLATILACTGVGILFGFLAVLLAGAAYIFASLILGTGISDYAPVLLLRILIPLGALVGLVFGASCD